MTKLEHSDRDTRSLIDITQRNAPAPRRRFSQRIESPLGVELIRLGRRPAPELLPQHVVADILGVQAQDRLRLKLPKLRGDQRLGNLGERRVECAVNVEDCTLTLAL